MARNPSEAKIPNMQAKKSIFCYNIYQTNHDERRQYNKLSTFNKSKSLINQSLPSSGFRSDCLMKQREFGTQTSRTVFKVAAKECDAMSLDSLCITPNATSPKALNSSWNCPEKKDDKPENRQIPPRYPCSQNPFLETPHTPLMKKPNPFCYFQEKKLENKESPQTHTSRYQSSLLETFLEKTKNRTCEKRRLFPDFFQHKIGARRSKSCIESKKCDTIPIKIEDKRKESIRTPEVVWIQEKETVKTPNNVWMQAQATFMNSTTAYENKNQMPLIQSINKLISPIKRGRSTSPRKICTNNLLITKKIPYIDQSKTNSTSDTTIAAKGSKTFNTIYHNDYSMTDDFCSTIDSKALRLIDQVHNRCQDSLSDINTNSSCMETTMHLELQRLKDPDWNIALRGLAAIVEITKMTDTEIMLSYMTLINQKLLELLKSPRSYVSRTACQAAGHLFEFVKDTRRPEFDDIVDTLLTKTADCNKFIRQDANLALDCMVTHIPTFHSIRSLCAKGPNHKNALVRTACARLLICAVVIAGAETLLSPNNNDFTRRRVFVHTAKFLEDKNLETRKYGRRLYNILSKESTFEMYLKKYIDGEQIARIDKILKYMARNPQ